jgi:hypothetical protein
MKIYFGILLKTLPSFTDTIDTLPNEVETFLIFGLLHIHFLTYITCIFYRCFLVDASGYITLIFNQILLILFISSFLFFLTF